MLSFMKVYSHSKHWIFVFLLICPLVLFSYPTSFYFRSCFTFNHYYTDLTYTRTCFYTWSIHCPTFPYLLDILQDRIKFLPILEIFTTKWLMLLPYPVLNPPFPLSLSSHTIISLLLIKLSLLPFPFPLNPLPMLRLPKILNGRLLWLLK